MPATPPPPPQQPAPALTAAQEAAFIGSACKGDHNALTALLSRYGPLVRQRLIGKIAGHFRGVLEEDDVMQVTYLEAFMRVSAFTPRQGSPGASFQAWLAQIAENNLRDAVRGLERAKRPDPRRRVTSRANQESYFSLVEVLGMTTTTPSRVAAKNEAFGCIEDALAKLPPDYRRVVTLYDLECRPIEAVAAELKRSHGAVFMLRARAHDRLREVLGAASNFFSRHA